MVAEETREVDAALPDDPEVTEAADDALSPDAEVEEVKWHRQALSEVQPRPSAAEVAELIAM